jgi:hypothetical protein
MHIVWISEILALKLETGPGFHRNSKFRIPDDPIAKKFEKSRSENSGSEKMPKSLSNPGFLVEFLINIQNW